MPTATLKDLYIVSITEDSADFTALAQSQFAEWIQSNPTAPIHKLPLVFPYDPNPGVLKATVITYQYVLKKADEKQVFSAL